MRYLATLLTMTVFWAASAALAADYALITNPSTPVEAVSKNEVKNFYLGKKTSWSDGSTVTVYTQSASPVHGDFIHQMVQKTPQQFTTYWKKSLFTGTGLPPKDFENDQQMKEAVAAKPGSLGYIMATSLDETVKQLEIQ